MHQYSQIYNRVMALDYWQNFGSAENLVNASMEFDKILHECIEHNQIYIGIVMDQFLQIYNRVMAGDYHQNLILLNILRTN